MKSLDEQKRIVQLAYQFIGQMEFSFDRWGPCIAESNPEERNNLSLWLKKYHPFDTDLEDEITNFMHLIWPIDEIGNTGKYGFIGLS